MSFKWSVRFAGNLSLPAATRARWAIRIGVAFLVLLVLVPAIDLVVSGWFYQPGNGFLWRGPPVPEFIHESIQILSRVVGVALLLGFIAALIRARRRADAPTLLGWKPREWLFLFLALVIAPGLVANSILKDNWGRARPIHIEQFGGQRNFSPPLVVTNQCDNNCSFVAGDAAVGFYLQAFAYVARRRSGAVLAAGMGAGLLAGLLRVGMGGHFFSDVIFAGVFMTLTIALVHAALFGSRQTAALWRSWTSWLHRESA